MTDQTALSTDLLDAVFEALPDEIRGVLSDTWGHQVLRKVAAAALSVAAPDRDELTGKLREAELDNARLRHILAATDPTVATLGSEVFPVGTTRESWLSTRLEGGAGYAARDAGRVILATVPRDDPRREALVEALHTMVDEINRWKDAWSATTVDADHKVRRALQQGDSCEFHGQQLAEQGRQITALDKAQARTEGARLALVGLLSGLREFTDAYRASQRLDRPKPDPDEIVAALEKVTKKASAAHDRAWHK